MGANSSSTAELKIDISTPSRADNGPFGREVAIKAIRSISICRILDESKESLATGVAVRIQTKKGMLLQGILTHVIDALLVKYVTYGDQNCTSIDGAICYTCPIMEITFITLRDETIQTLEDADCNFYNLHEPIQSIEKDSPVFLVKAFDKTTITCVEGNFIENYGLDVLCRCITSKSSSCFAPGLPVVSSTGQLVGLYKSVAAACSDGTNGYTRYLAISLTHVASILSNLVLLQVSLVSNPIDVSFYANKLEEKGLESMPDLIIRNFTVAYKLYVSPREPYITPIWFAPTYLGWFWTPTDPRPNGELNPNWMPVNKLAVSGGEWDSQIPAPKNTLIIRWLDQNNIDCGKVTKTE